MNWVWFQFAHLNISFSLYSCHNNSCILTSITSWHWSWWKIWCLFYLNQKKITCWVWSLCPLLLQLATYRYAYFTFSALWIISSAVWLWGPWFDKQANCHGNPASLALPEVLTEHFHFPLRSDMSKPRLMCPFHFRRLFPHYGWHLQAKKHVTEKSYAFQIKTRQRGREELGSSTLTTQVGKEECNVLTSTHWKQRSQHIWGQTPEKEQLWV